MDQEYCGVYYTGRNPSTFRSGWTSPHKGLFWVSPWYINIFILDIILCTF